MKPFRKTGATVTISASTTSAHAAISDQGEHVRVLNLGSVAAFVCFGRGATLTATVAEGVPVGPNEAVTLFKGACTRVGVITNSGSSTVFLCPGEEA